MSRETRHILRVVSTKEKETFAQWADSQTARTQHMMLLKGWVPGRTENNEMVSRDSYLRWAWGGSLQGGHHCYSSPRHKRWSSCHAQEPGWLENLQNTISHNKQHRQWWNAGHFFTIFLTSHKTLLWTFQFWTQHTQYTLNSLYSKSESAGCMKVWKLKISFIYNKPINTSLKSPCFL